jgi:small nuclear ribonucleoprotein (snRNP)-like protein
LKEKQDLTKKYPIENENEHVRKFAKDILGTVVRATLQDGRIIYGKLTCIDKRNNLVFQEAIE